MKRIEIKTFVKIELPVGTKVLVNGIPYIVSKRPEKLDEKGCKMCLNGFPFPERKFLSANIYLINSCYSCIKEKADSICILDNHEMIDVEGSYVYMEREQLE